MRPLSCMIFGVGILGLLVSLPLWASAANHPAAPDAGVLSLNIENAIELALSANRSLLAAGCGIQSQRLSLDSAAATFDVQFIPGTNLGLVDGENSAGAQLAIEKKFENGLQAALTPGVATADDGYALNVGLELDVPLLKGFGRAVNLDGVLQARYALRSAQNTLLVLKVNTIVGAVATLYEIITQEQLVALYRSHVRRLGEHAAAARAKEKIGLASPIDIYRARIKSKDAEDSLAQALEALSSVKDDLKLILGLPPEQAIRVSAPVEIAPVELDLPKAVHIALEHRVELAAALDNIEEARRLSAVARHNCRPELNLVLGYDLSQSADTFSAGPEDSDQSWSVSLESSTDWFRTSAKADFQKSLVTVQIANLAYESRKDEIKREVRQRFSELKKAATRIRVLKEQIHEAEGKLALARIKFDHAMADNFDLIEAETELQRAHTNLLAVKTDYIVGTYRLRAAMGTLLEN